MSISERLTRNSVLELFTLFMKGFTECVTPDGAHGVIPSQDSHLQESSGDPLFVIRSMWAMGAYLHNSRLPRILYTSKGEIAVDTLFVKALTAGTNPEDQGYWDYRKHPELAIESAAVGWACAMAKSIIFKHMNTDQILRVEHWLEGAGKLRMGTPVNKYLSIALNHSARKVLNWRYDENAVDKLLDKFESQYKEDGWFVSGSPGGSTFDDTNFNDILPHFCYLMILERDSDSRLFHTWTSRLNRLLRDFPYFFAADGSHPEYGRGTVYTFARLTGAVLAHKLGISPLKSGVLKRIIRLHIQYYLNRGAIDSETGVMRGRLASEGSSAAMDLDDSPGGFQQSMQAVGALLLLEEDDPLWSAKEEKLPVEKGDFLKIIQAPGWMLHGTMKDGHIQLINGGADAGKTGKDDTLILKYGKFVYSSHLGYVAGPRNDGQVFPCDSTLSASSTKDTWSHRNSISGFRIVGKEGILSQYNLTVWGKSAGKMIGQLKVDTLIVPLRSGGQIRVHRIRRGMKLGKETPVYLREGGYALGINPGEKTKTEAKGGTALAEGEEAFSSIHILAGYKYAALSQGYEGITDTHTRKSTFLLPRVEAMLPSEKVSYFGVFCKGGVKQIAASAGEDLSMTAEGEVIRLFYKGKEFFTYDLAAKE